MMRTLPVCAVLLTLPLVGRADGAPQPTETVIRMTVRPMPAPKPAMRYQLLPELREMNPGNPIQGYLKCFMEQGHFYHNKEAADKREKWLEMPLKDLPLKEMQYYKTNAGLRQADYAARLDTPDWQILLKIRSDGINLLLPDVQVLRSLAAALKVRFRLEIAERRIDDALATAKTMFGLSRHLGEHPTLIGDLVAIAVAYITIGPLEELIQTPGCPSLFWALTDLPQPFVNLRKGIQGERVFLGTDLALLDDRAPMNDAQLQKAVNHLQGLMKAINVKKDVSVWLKDLAKNEEDVRAARKRLIESGLAEDKVKAFPARQVILLDEKLEYEVHRDAMAKVMGLPFWQAEPTFHDGKLLRPEREDTLFAGLVMGKNVKQAQARLDQRIALLRCVEALRLYAAEHDGKLPATLVDPGLPLPVDPITGKPFHYRVEDGTKAILHGTPPRGLEKNAHYNVRYEVTIAK
jgi:hypothetical protein